MLNLVIVAHEMNWLFYPKVTNSYADYTDEHRYVTRKYVTKQTAENRVVFQCNIIIEEKRERESRVKSNL